MQQLIIQGMHCDACKKLIMMELEDASLDIFVDSISVEDDNKGIMILKNATEDDIMKIKNSINAMDGYHVE